MCSRVILEGRRESSSCGSWILSLARELRTHEASLYQCSSVPLPAPWESRSNGDGDGFLLWLPIPRLSFGHHGHHSPVSWIWEAVAKAMALVSGITSVAMSKQTSMALHWISSVYAQSFQEIQPMICFCSPHDSAVNI